MSIGRFDRISRYERWSLGPGSLVPPPPIVNITLLQAIEAFFGASTVAPSFASSGGLWLEEIPEKQVVPFICIFHNGEVPEYTTEDNYLERGQVQFEIFTDGLEVAETLAEAVKRLFDPLCQSRVAAVSLLFQNATGISMTRTGYHVDSVQERDKNQHKVYHITIPYETVVRKSLAVPGP